MSNLRVTNPLESSAPNQTPQSCCSNSTIVKISLIVFGLLLIGGAITAYIYQVNAIAVYTVGGVGGILILATVIGSIIHCVLQRNFIQTAVPWDEEPHPLPKGWEKHRAEQTIVVQYGKGVTIPKGNTYFTYNGKIAIGWHNTYNPPRDMY